MRLLLWLLTLAALAVGLSMAAQYNNGYALLVLPPWRVELSLNLLIVLLLAGFIVLHIVLRIISAMVRLPASVMAFRAARARIKGESGLRDAMQMMIEGRYGRALKRAEDAYDANHAPGLAALLALFAARAMRDRERDQVWREKARGHDKEIHSARLMLEATYAIEDRDYIQAKSLLDQLTKESGRHIAALRLALRTQQGLGNWHEVLHIVRQLEKHKAMTPAQCAPLRQRAHSENIKAMEEDGMALEKYLDRMPGEDKRDPRLALATAQALIRARHCEAASRLIEDVLDDTWDSALVAAYAGCNGGDVMGRIARAEAWLQSHPRDMQLLLTLGRLCRQLQLWGKAQSYFEASLAIEPARQTHLELAALFDYLDKPDEANRHYRAAAGF